MDAPQDFFDFISASPSAFHAAEEVARRLEAAGFTRQGPAQAWDAQPGGHVLSRDGAVVAWWVPDALTGESGFRIVGAHTDSPGFALKPHPDRAAFGFAQAAVEVYGGPIVHSWFDRELTLAGRVTLADGSTRLVDTGPVARIANLAIHLERKNEFNPHPQEHTSPILALEGDASVSELLAEAAGCEPDEILGHTVITADTQPPRLFGAAGDLIAAGRLDNLSSVYCGLEALKGAAGATETGGDVLVLAAFNNEEVGSESTSGAAGPLLTEVVERTAAALGLDREETYRMLARSSMVSADAAHSVHPNFAGKHDPGHLPLINRGPVTKINAKQRYASTDRTVAAWRRACRAAGVNDQVFVGNNAVPCGSTIGPISATRVGIPTVDVGIPLLSMHSARELAGAADVEALTRALRAYLAAAE